MASTHESFSIQNLNEMAPHFKRSFWMHATESRDNATTIRQLTIGRIGDI